MDEERGEVEATLPGGAALRAKGYRMMDLVCLLTAAGVVAGAYYAKSYAAEGERAVQAVKESNKAVVDSLKENSTAMVEAMKQMSAEQRRASDIAERLGREQTCILLLPPDRRTNAGDFCKALSRQRER